MIPGKPAQIDCYQRHIWPYFSVLHGPVLRSYISVTVYGDRKRPYFFRKRSWLQYPGRWLRNPYTLVNDRILSYYMFRITIVYLRACIRSNTIIHTEKNEVKWRPYMTFMYWDSKRSFFFLRISPYFSGYDTEINGRNTGPCKSSYFSVYDRLWPCLFDPGNYGTHRFYCFIPPFPFDRIHP
jgi:hypothetical protein